MALTAENERFHINCKEWQQKLKDSEERSSASMRDLQDECKSLENVIENLKRELEEAFENHEREMREMEEGLQEGWEEQEAGLEKESRVMQGLGFRVVSQFIGFLSTSSGGSKKGDRSVKDSVKSAIKVKTQRLKDELAKVKAELTASEKTVDELKKRIQELLQEQQNTSRVCDARETAQKEMQVQLTANVQSLEANVQRLEAELATTKTKAAALDNICNAKESELEEIKSGLARQGLDKSVQTAVSSEDASIITNDIVDAENAAASTCNDPHAGNIAQESELTEIRGKLSAQEELFEVYERDLKSCEKTLENKHQAKLELEQLVDADVQHTVDRAEQARRSVFFFLFLSVLWWQAQLLMHRATCREHREAKKNFETAVAKVERIKEERQSLKAKFKEKLSEVIELNYSFLWGLK